MSLTFSDLGGTQNFIGADGYPAGTVSLPGIAFSVDPDSGIYRIGVNNIGVAVNGAKVLDIATTGLSVTGGLSATGNITLSGSGPTITGSGSAGSGYVTITSTNSDVYINATAASRVVYLNAGAGGTVYSYVGGSPITTTSSTGLAVTGALTSSGAFGVNGATAQAASTGYGTPTNAAKQASFDATSITLVNLAKATAQLILDLKAVGLLAA